MPVREQLATDQFDPWQIVPRQVFTFSSRLLISNAIVVVTRVGCLRATGVFMYRQMLATPKRVVEISVLQIRRSTRDNLG